MAKTDGGNCPEAIGNHQDGGQGKCSFCGTPMGARRKPRITERTNLGQEYRRHYDPDYGTDKDDT